MTRDQDYAVCFLLLHFPVPLGTTQVDRNPFSNCDRYLLNHLAIPLALLAFCLLCYTTLRADVASLTGLQPLALLLLSKIGFESVGFSLCMCVCDGHVVYVLCIL